MWWLAVLGLVGTIVSLIVSSFNTEHDYYVDVETVTKTENEHLKTVREYQESRG
jgi:cytochrome o ubiquinol oxidase subunit 1